MMKTMKKTIVFSENAPSPVGPYNHGVIFDDILYTSAQLGLDPATGTLVNDSLEAEVRQAMKNTEAVLKAAGIGFESCLKCNLVIADMNDFQRINAVYSEFFDDDTAPARACIAATVPKGGRFQIEVIAAL